ncbi:hypothetical protein [Nocardia bovistercoris]|uniref:Uncharacterized protein n=1 Tax=Nocardia bovistercoris TaxID=2785916 RepID=A0A931N5Y1_9NOCA|nr:hypothetical protein [Nocardia bovistercoris]MBH0780349.1 hypothetical protein [Nocardia bovistercoris]
MIIPSVWDRATWRRAASPTIPAVIEAAGHLVSEATAHHADYVGQDLWVVDFLPGRTLTREQARAAMKIAVAPDRPEVQRWAGLLGLTAAEARGFAALPVVVS